MLKNEQRAALLEYLTAEASDSVLVEAFENAQRENKHNFLVASNQWLAAKKKNKEEHPTAIIADPQIPLTDIPSAQIVVPLVIKTDLPTKLTAVGRELIDVLKRKGAPMCLADIAKSAQRSISQAKPQLALAVHRKLVKQPRTDLFEV